MTPDQRLQEMLAAVAEEALKSNENELCLILTVILGSYRFGSLKQYVDATKSYLGEQSAQEVLRTVQRSVAGQEPLVFFEN